MDKNNVYVPSSWDGTHSVSLTGGKRFKKGWEIGFRWLFSGGVPYTPIDQSTSSLINVWDINGRGLPNYNLLNSQRESNFHSLNVRIDKKYTWINSLLIFILTFKIYMAIKPCKPPFFY